MRGTVSPERAVAFEKGAAVDAQSEKGFTPLILRASAGCCSGAAVGADAGAAHSLIFAAKKTAAACC